MGVVILFIVIDGMMPAVPLQGLAAAKGIGDIDRSL